MMLLAFLIGYMVPTGAAPTAQLDAVVQAISQGDAAAVGSYFDATVELVLPGVEDILPKAKAQTQLANFFEAHPAKSFARVHGGTSTGEQGAYVIGTLTTSTGKWRVYVYGKGEGSPTVQELRIEPE